MRKILIGIIAILTFGLGIYHINVARVQGANSTTYYISSSTGNDSNDGLSASTPWKNLDKIYKKSYSGSPFTAGDQILLKRGDTWNGQIWVKATGVNGNPIIIDAYGDGAKPIVNGEVAASWSLVPGYTNIYQTAVGEGSIIGRGFDGTTALSGKSWDTGDLNAFLATLTPGSYGPTSGTNTIYVRALNNSLPTNVRLFRDATIFVWAGSNYITIRNLNIQRGNTGIDVNAASNITLSNNDIIDTFGIGFYLRVGNSQSLIENNTTTRTGNDGIYIYQSTNNTARGNKISYVQSNILGFTVGGDQCGLGLQESTNSLVEKNSLDHSICGIDYYYDNGSTVRQNYLSAAGGISPHGTNLQVYSNIINLQSGGNGMNAVETGTGKILVYNNVFYNSADYGLMGSSASGQVIFRNNIIYSASNGAYLADFGANTSSDYNLWYKTTSPRWSNNGSEYTSLASFQATTGKDTHSLFGDPQLVTAPPLLDSDFRLKNTSPALGKGLNLISAGLVSANYNDYADAAFPPSAAPDIGAYNNSVIHVAPTITKSADKSSAIKDEVLTYTLSYKSGSQNISGVTIQDPLPSGTTYVSGSATNNGTFDGTKIIWNLGNLVAGTIGTLTFQVKIQ